MVVCVLKCLRSHQRWPTTVPKDSGRKTAFDSRALKLICAVVTHVATANSQWSRLPDTQQSYKKWAFTQWLHTKSLVAAFGNCWFNKYIPLRDWEHQLLFWFKNKFTWTSQLRLPFLLNLPVPPSIHHLPVFCRMGFFHQWLELTLN